VVDTHDQRGWNYVWLAPMLGMLQWVEFREPAKTGPWRHYTRFWWARHGCAVSHDPNKLVDEHVKFFVGPQRVIDLRFYFETPAGWVYSAEPTRDWYELEAAFFLRHGLCAHRHAPTAKQLAEFARNASDEGLAPHWGPEVLHRPVLAPPYKRYSPEARRKRSEEHRKRRRAGLAARYPRFSASRSEPATM